VSEAAGSLGVVIDGEPLPADEARAFWSRFSAHMEEHKGDLAGFATKEGFASVHPSMRNGAPVLLASRSSAQRAYAPVGRGDEAKAPPGSSDHRASPHDPRKVGGTSPKGSKRRRRAR